jgi:type II secretory pathway component PulK
MRAPMPRSERGVALLIVLLVTALLIALIFEFSYATRISLNSAINFRDSQRAYFLARSGIFAFVKYGDKLRDSYIPQGEWGIVPMISDGDTAVRIMWEDERGKININTVSTLDWVERLFSSKGIGIEVVESIKELKKGKTFVLLSELHAVMSDEDYNKVVSFMTTDSDNIVNINTASADVLNSIFWDKPNVVMNIINARKTALFQSKAVAGITTENNISPAIINNVDTASQIFRVYSYTTVGGYTKQVEAVVKGSIFSYWRSL